VNIFLLFTLSLLLSCVPGQEAEVSVQGQSSIVNQVRLSSDVPKNIGDWSLDSDPLDFTVTVTNNSSHAITALSASLTKLGQIDGLDYTTTTAIAFYPGTGGTCAKRLESGESCTIKLTYEPTQSGRMTYNVKFDYKTLIEAESQSLTFTSLAGTPASLVFTNENSNYDLGIIEQVDDEPGEKRFPFITRLEIQNRGELSARNLESNLVATNDQPNAFSVTSNTCPELLPRNGICTVDVAYNPFNQDVNDPETTYQSSFSIRYGKDQNDRPATLTGAFKVLSTKIEGRFEKSGLQSFCFKLNEETPCGPITVGNTATSSFKVINQGYQDAILKKIVVAKNDLLVYCEENGQTNLLCYRYGGNPAVSFDETGYECTTVSEDGRRHCLLSNITKNQLTLYQFPFLLQDTDNCMANETRVSGKDILNVGSERCEVGIKFHPPIDYNKVGQFIAGQEIDELPAAGTPPIEVGVIYDSLWKDKVNTYLVSSPPLFQTEPKSLSEARVRVTRFTFGSLIYNYKTLDQTINAGDTIVDYNTTDFRLDLGRYPMVLDNSISVQGRILVKNFGATRADITSVFSNHGDTWVDIPSKDASGTNRVDLTCAPSGEPFFRNVRHFCSHDPDTGASWIDPDATCEIRFDFTPVSETNKIFQNYCMFGIPTNDARYGPACQASPSSCNVIMPFDHRDFLLGYNNGITEDDNLNPFTGNDFIDFQLDATLAASGKLEVAPLNDSNVFMSGATSLSMTGVDPGFYEYGFVELRNVGSNSIPYIYLEDNFNMHPDTISTPESLGLNFVQANRHPFILGGTNNSNGNPYKDCYYLIQNKPQDSTFGQFTDLFPNVLPHQAGTTYNNTNFVTALDNYQGNPGTPVTSLDSGESCILAIRHKTPYGFQNELTYDEVKHEDYVSTPSWHNAANFFKSFPFDQENCDGRIESLSINNKKSGIEPAELKFYYFDNDTDTSNGAVPDNAEIGNRRYVFQSEEEVFEVDSDEAKPYVVYPSITQGPLNAMLRASEKNFPGVNNPPFFNLDGQVVPAFNFTRDASPYYGHFASIDTANAVMNNTESDIEGLVAGDFNDYDFVLNLGSYPNRDGQDYKVTLNLNRAGFSDDFDSITYSQVYTPGTATGHHIAATSDVTNGEVVFRISPATVISDYHIGELEFTYKTNVKVESSRVANPCNDYMGNAGNNGDADSNLVMLDIDDNAKFDYVTVTKKILVYMKPYIPADTGQLRIFTQDYKVCQNPATGVISENDPYDNTDDANCSGMPAVAAEVDHDDLYKLNNWSYNSSDLSSKTIQDIVGDDLYQKFRIRIQNYGAQDINILTTSVTNGVGEFVNSSGEGVFSSPPSEMNGRDYAIVRDGSPNHPGGGLSACGGTLAAGDSCTLYVQLRAISVENNFSRWFTINYQFGDETARMVEKFQINFQPLQPAQILVEGFGTPFTTINDTSDDVAFVVDDANISRFRDLDYGNDWEQGSTVDAIRLPMGVVNLNAAPTRFQFSLKLTADSGTLSAFIRQELFNHDTQGTDWNAATYSKTSNVDGNSRFTIDYDPDVFLNFPGEQTCANFHAGDAPMNDGESCVIAVNYWIDESFINAPTSSNVNGHEGFFLDFCNNYPGSNPSSCSTGRMYFTFTGDFNFANATTQSTGNIQFSNVQADDTGRAYFEWDAVLANSNWSNGVTDYIIKYGAGTEKRVSALATQGDGSVAQRWGRIAGLIRGDYYTFEIIPVVDSKFSTEDYNVSFVQGPQTIKLMVPDNGLEYLHDQASLIKSVSVARNYTDLETECSKNIKVGNGTQKMSVINTTQYNMLTGLNHDSVSPFKAYWASDTDFVDDIPTAQVECLFPDPTIEQNQTFSDSKIWRMLGDTEAAGYKTEGHDDCTENFLWIPEFFIDSSLEAEGVCIYEGLDL
jgi:hypothetical protein